MNAKLIVVGGEAKTKEVKLKFPCIIGRGKGATLLLPHPLVSRQHCEIFEANGQLMVRDLGSLNGTYVNNEKIEDAYLLAPGQLLTVGSVTFRAEYAADQPDRVPSDRPTVVTSATAAMKAMPAVPVAVHTPEPEEPETIDEPNVEVEAALPPEADLQLPEEEAPLDDDFAGLSSEPLFAPDPPPAAVPVAKPAPKAIPVAAPTPAAAAQEEEEEENDDDDLNDFLNSLGTK
jgi:predicted component of type VI protein secretion system